MTEGAAAGPGSRKAAGGSTPLPAVVRIFPLSGALLLPRAELPLHIFEPRYRAMTAAALADDGTIAMIQPNGGDDAVNPPLFDVGCLGRITEARKTDDGRYFLTLTGVSRFRVLKELPGLDGYRRVEADYTGYAVDATEDRAPAVDRDRLIAAVKAFIGSRGLAADWAAIDLLRMEPLVNAFAMMCPFSPTEKQALLEAADLAERGRLLTTLFEMSALPTGSDPAVRH